jgi:hypothetical protein
MKLRFMNHPAAPPVSIFNRHRSEFAMLLVLVLAALAQHVIAQQPVAARADKPDSLGAQQIVQNLVQMNLRRLHALNTYQGTRTYRVEYRGFAGPRSAEMIVDVKYRSPGMKEFVVQSATGSKLLIDQGRNLHTLNNSFEF